MAQVRLRDVVKRYGAVEAVRSLSLTIEDGEFVALVGPSGCGKTTTLNLIAGLLELSDGEIFIGDRRVNDLDPKDRDIAMVFQNYALYPNKTIYKNLAFPLQMRRLAAAEIDRRVREAARVLDITHLLDRRPRELSGGQQQRVALGRALVRDPRAFLMDEPLSNLDAKLRVQMRAELKRFHQDLGATVIYVTHDQLEAVTMADRMAVMHGGVLQQYDTPERVFAAPINTFVAGFVGSPAMNLLAVRIDGATLEGEGGWRLDLSPENVHRIRTAVTRDIVLGARHSSISLDREPGPLSVPARIYTVEPTGDITFAHVRLGTDTIVISVSPDVHLAPDTRIWLTFDQRRLHFFDGQSGSTLVAAEAQPGSEGPPESPCTRTQVTI
jgi:multiple sugar transport system ATP-binding protein